MTADDIQDSGLQQAHRRNRLLAAGLIVATCIAYFPAFQCGYIWEDDDYITRNFTLQQGAEGLRRIWFEFNATPQYYPLVHTTFWLEYQIWQLDPRGYHVTNVLLHVMTVILLWRLLERLKVPGAWLAALIFAVHPVHVDSVAWITERKNTLSAFFYMAAAHLYLRFDENPNDSRRWYTYVFSLTLFLMSLLSKTVTTTLPAAILLVIWWKRGAISRRDALSVLPFFALAIPMGLVTVLLETKHVGTEQLELGLAPIDRILIAGRALWFYVGKLVWPNNLIFIYPRWEIDARVWWQYLFPASFLALLAALWMFREKIGRGPLVAFLYFAGTLVPALGFFDLYPMLYTFVMDHFQYLGSIGIITLAASAFAVWQQYLGSRHVIWTNAVAAIIVVALGWNTWSRCQVYESIETLFADTVARNRAAWLAHNNLGHFYVSEGRYDDAIGAFTQAIEHCPDFVPPSPNFINANFNRGVVYELKGEFSRALSDYTSAIERNPDQMKCLEHRSRMYLVLGDSRRAMKDITTVIEKQSYPKALAIRARIHLIEGSSEAAIADFQAAGAPPNVETEISYLLLGLSQGNLKNEFHLRRHYPSRIAEIEAYIQQIRKHK